VRHRRGAPAAASPGDRQAARRTRPRPRCASAGARPGRARLCADSLGLAVGKTYTTYVDVGRDTLLLVLSASRRDKLRESPGAIHRGRCAYKGFFKASRARAEGQQLESQGSRFLAPLGRVLTLGYLSDSLFSTAMSRDTMELVATVIHELAHNTLYVKSQTRSTKALQLRGLSRRRGILPRATRYADARRGRRAGGMSARWTCSMRSWPRLDSAYVEPLSGSAWSRSGTRCLVGQAAVRGPWAIPRDLRLALVRAGAAEQRRGHCRAVVSNGLESVRRVYLQNNADIAETVRAIQIRVFTQSDRRSVPSTLFTAWND